MIEDMEKCQYYMSHNEAVLLSSVFWKKNEDLVLKTDEQHLRKGDYRAMSYLGKYRISSPNHLFLGFSTRDILASESESQWI